MKLRYFISYALLSILYYHSCFSSEQEEEKTYISKVPTQTMTQKFSEENKVVQNSPLLELPNDMLKSILSFIDYDEEGYISRSRLAMACSFLKTFTY